MKRLLFSIWWAFVAVFVFAQSTMYIEHHEEGQIGHWITKIPVEHIDSIVFVHKEPLPPTPTPVHVVKAGNSYKATNESIGIEFVFTVVSTSGSYMSRNQIVTVSIDGVEYTLSDAGDSYLIYSDGKFFTGNTATAINNAPNIVMCLACSNSNADYTLTSATINDRMYANGATTTEFIKED